MLAVGSRRQYGRLEAVMQSQADIPKEVLDALRFVRSQLPDDAYDPETVTLFAGLFGFHEASDWLLSHQSLYFEALRRCPIVRY